MGALWYSNVTIMPFIHVAPPTPTPPIGARSSLCFLVPVVLSYAMRCWSPTDRPLPSTSGANRTGTFALNTHLHSGGPTMSRLIVHHHPDTLLMLTSLW